ncbi:MAG: LuxR family transcriptional regulator [Alphaproteobacteria bacterium]|nr:MAG: LuxR family transcriptional regulator [Alphaproteobacteria bacterium]
MIDLSDQPHEDRPFVDFLRQVCETFGVEHAAYAGMNPFDRSIHGFVTYSEEWKAHYADNDLARIDPTLLRASRSIAPVNWTRLPRDTLFDRVFRDAADFGITTNGLTIPVRGPHGDVGMLSVNGGPDAADWDRLVREIVGGLQSAAVHIHDTVMRSGELGRVLHTAQLSAREREVLQWIAVGKTQADVGDILSISGRTVEVHLRSAREKLGALTTAQAVARAIGMGLIYPA